MDFLQDANPAQPLGKLWQLDTGTRLTLARSTARVKYGCLIDSWLFNRDPYFMVYYNPHITG